MSNPREAQPFFLTPPAVSTSVGSPHLHWEGFGMEPGRLCCWLISVPHSNTRLPFWKNQEWSLLRSFWRTFHVPAALLILWQQEIRCRLHLRANTWGDAESTSFIWNHPKFRISGELLLATSPFNHFLCPPLQNCLKETIQGVLILLLKLDPRILLSSLTPPWQPVPCEWYFKSVLPWA